MEKLISLGWNTFFENQFNNYKNSGFIPARVIIEHKQRYLLYTEKGEVTGEVTGKLLYTSDTNSELPKTGDWVVGILYEEENKLIIHDVLERKTKLSRKTADKNNDEQIIAINVDIVFIVQSIDNNFNPNRLDRYLTAVNESGAKSVIILNKTDLVENPEEKINQLKNRGIDIPVLLMSAQTNEGVSEIKKYLSEGITAVFAGSSGVGKSTIINSLLGNDFIKTQEISSSVFKGKHTTTKRELIVLPEGGILIDTPGMREFQLWNVSEGLDSTFNDIESLTTRCKFNNCSHTVEIGCAVMEALNDGSLSVERYKSYQKLQKELLYLEQRQSISAKLAKKELSKKINRYLKEIYKYRK